MATMNFVRTILRPGIQSIEIYGEGSMGNWVPVERVAEGRAVKFVVTTYPNFTLTSWEAYYSDEYDDTVSLTLTSVTGQSAWTFTMPSADVYIRCEAVSNPIPGTHEWPPVDLGRNEIFTIDYLADLESVYNRAVYLAGRSGDTKPFPTVSAVVANAISAGTSCAEVINNAVAGNLIGVTSSPYQISTSVYIRRIDICAIPGGYTLPFNTSVNNPPSGPSGGIGVRMLYDHRNNTFSETWRLNNETVLMIPGTRFDNDIIPLIGGVAGFSINNGQGNSSPPLTENSIRYIMSPENSGEVDASAPIEFVQGTTEFTFKWRIKAAYEFKRLTPFAVGEGSLEDDISYSLDSYDGDTRTYTFTVTQIPDWAIGVRVLIETIMFDDPSNAGGTNASDTSVGGDGTYDDSSDEVPLPAIPSGISASDSGLVTLFRPSITQVKDFGNYLWSNITDFIENLQKIFTSPMDYVIGFNIFPVTPAVGADRDIYIGNWLSNIQMPPVLNQFYEFNAGVIQVKEYFGSFLDYYPNTRARIMLPFIGDREININEIMGKTLHLWYRIDLLSGACVAILNINDNVYYQWNGNCAVAVPVTGSDWSRLYSGIARAGLIVGSTLAFGAAGGITASMTTQTLSGAEQAAAVSAVSDSFASLPKGVPGVAAMRRSLTDSLENISEPRKTIVESHSSRALQASTMVRAVGYNVMGGSSRAQHTGDMTGAITIMGNRTPYLVLEYPDVNLPENYKHIFGYPSNQYAVLGNLSGYTKCKEVMFESTTATDDEIEMIISALKGGVYL